MASFATLFFAFFVLVYLPKGRVEPDLFNLLKDILEYDFYIILSGLGFITADNFGKMMVERVKAKFRRFGGFYDNIGGGLPPYRPMNEEDDEHLPDDKQDEIL